MALTETFLDNPIWSALSTRQRHLAQATRLAARYDPGIAPFAGMPEPSPDCLVELRSLIAASAPVAMFTPEPIDPPRGVTVVRRGVAEQMVGRVGPEDGAVAVLELGPDDMTEMQALVELTRPGPFSARMLECGRFMGVRQDGRLVAMTGERMNLPGHTEMTAVCVDPEYRGRGLGQAVMAAVSDGIVARGDEPFLHVFTDNAAALMLYRRVGLEVRRQMHLTVLATA